MNMKSMSALFLSLFLTLSVLAPFQAKAAFQAEDALSIEEEYAYRQKIESEAAKWAKDLIFMQWEMLDGPKQKDSSARSLSSELAWMTVMGHGVLATFDFKHSEVALLGQIPIGSTSRLVAALKRSKNFWTEVRSQCRQMQDHIRARSEFLKRPDPTGPDFLRQCRDRLERDMATSQIIGSNVSLFVGGGVVVGLSTRLYRRYASQWVAARVLPLIPAFARGKYVAAGLVGAVIILPAGVLVASISEEQRTQQVFLDDLQTSLTDNSEESKAESVLRQKSLKQEREVLEFALWIGQRLPKNMSETESENFLLTLRLTAPHYQTLKSDRAALETRRDQIERELQAIPDVAVKLQALADAKKKSKLSGDDAVLFRKAQHLAALRLVLRAVSADQQSLPSGD